MTTIVTALLFPIRFKIPVDYGELPDPLKSGGVPALPPSGAAALPTPHKNKWTLRLVHRGMFIDVFLLGVVNAHQRLDRFDDALRIADQIAVDLPRIHAIREPRQQPG